MASASSEARPFILDSTTTLIVFSPSGSQMYFLTDRGDTFSPLFERPHLFPTGLSSTLPCALCTPPSHTRSPFSVKYAYSPLSHESMAKISISTIYADSGRTLNVLDMDCPLPLLPYPPHIFDRLPHVVMPPHLQPF